MKRFFASLVMLVSASAVAAPYEGVDIFTVYTSSLVGVFGDEEEVDLNHDDDYSYLSLDADRIKGARWIHIDSSADMAANQRFPFYLEYSTIDVKSDDGKTHSDRYQSFTFGFAFQGVISTESQFLDTYFGLFAGGGVARFSFDEPEYKAVGEIGGEYGIIIGNRFSLGLGVKRQIIGYPGETMAQVWHGNIAAGIWF
ncbi:hypothetical protein [Psychromonas algicola]|uniref:hypothetical protein n=1 Tax=Psychromonas algicola TaxID=2555642 RepID=UPI001067BC2D|nr:hypothetical protein [Psychromonas sp. RZ5]TEW49819.1 hypothetical protein E2R67_10120 [Psychromonas sp. RZ5]